MEAMKKPAWVLLSRSQQSTGAGRACRQMTPYHVAPWAQQVLKNTVIRETQSFTTGRISVWKEISEQGPFLRAFP